MKRFQFYVIIGPIFATGFLLGLLIKETPFRAHADNNPNVIAIPKELTSYRNVVKKALPAVVSIETISAIRQMPVHNTDGQAPKQNPGENRAGFGSGVIVDPHGVILTNFHVIERAKSATIILNDGRRYPSIKIHSDPKTDLAIIRIKPDKLLPALELGDSDAMEVGDRVLAIGAPFGLAGSVSHGIISAKSRNLHLNQFEDFLQTDAAINPGNSGGPLISLDGRVIGINSVIKSRSGGFQGIGMAISSKLVKNIMNQLLVHGKVKRGYLGVQIDDIDEATKNRLKLKSTLGVLITGTITSSPAARAAIQIDDVIVQIDGKSIRNCDDLSRIVADKGVNEIITVRYIRHGDLLTTSIRVEEQQ